MQNFLHNWTELRSTNFSDQSIDILLGNGFSRRYSCSFAYDSLFQVFLKNCDSANLDAFKVLETDNFEEILDFLTKANAVNGCLTRREQRIDDCIEELKTGLIKSVKDIHPFYDCLNIRQLNSDATTLLGFDNVFTTNYDLILYYTILIANDQYRTAHNGNYKFQDNFSVDSGSFLEYNWYLEKELNVHYLHGSLILYTDDYESTYKIRKSNDDEELIGSISLQIKRGNIPLFVSEGDHKKKEGAIRSNRYLELCFERFKQTDNPQLILGHALNEKADGHILKALFAKPNRPVIVAIKETSASHSILSHQARIIESATKSGYNIKNLYFVKAETVMKKAPAFLAAVVSN